MRIETAPRALGEAPVGAIMMTPLFGLPLGAWLVETDTISLGKCGFKTAFGLPCISCGSTRATLHLLHGDFLGALAFQPLTLTLYLLLVIWGLTSLWALLRRRSVRLSFSEREEFWLKVGLVAVPLMNWSYLIAAGV